jgi:hypothetical protein
MVYISPTKQPVKAATREKSQSRSRYIEVKVEVNQFGYPKARATSCFVMANGLLTPHGKNGRQHRYLQWTRWAAPHFPLASKFLEDTWAVLGQACFFEHAQINRQQLVGMRIP